MPVITFSIMPLWIITEKKKKSSIVIWGADGSQQYKRESRQQQLDVLPFELILTVSRYRLLISFNSTNRCSSDLKISGFCSTMSLRISEFFILKKSQNNKDFFFQNMTNVCFITEINFKGKKLFAENRLIIFIW